MDIRNVYPRIESNREYYRARFVRAAKGYAVNFPGGAPRLFSAPGRTEIGGNHTDHQHGHVLAAAVDMDILGAAAENGENRIRVLSEGYDMVEIDLADLSPRENEKNASAALIRGIAARLHALGHAARGFDAYLISDVLKGSGLSSSAAFEVWMGTAMNRLFCGGVISPPAIAQIGQYAENVYFGKPSGLMDQMACALGGVVALDFLDTQNPGIEVIPIEFEKTGHALCIIDSGADHADLTDEYAAIPAEMGRVCAFFGKEYLRQVRREDFLAHFADIRKTAGDRALLRALHYFDDDARAVEEAACLREGRFDDFLRAIKASGISSFVHLQNVHGTGATEHQAVAVALAACDLLLDGRGACRVHGGGFAGTVQAFVPFKRLPAFREGIRALLGDNRLHEVAIRPAGGVEIPDWRTI